MRYFFNYYKKFYIPLILVALFSVVSYYMLFDSIITTKQSIIHMNEEKVSIIANQIKDYFNEKVRLSKTIGQTITSMESKNFSKDEIRTITKDIIANYKDIESIIATDKHGKIKIYINNESENLESKYLNKSISFREYFKNASMGRETISNVLNDIGTNKEVLVISTPYYDHKRSFNGIIGITIPKDKVSKLLKSHNQNKNEYITVVDENSKMFVHPKLSAARKAVETNDFLDNVLKDMKSGKASTVEIKSAVDNKVKLLSYTKIKNSHLGVIYVNHISKIYIPIIKQFIINLNMLFVVGLFIYLILKTYFLQMKREEDFLIYNMERLEILGQISAGVAHEIRNPLSTIKGYLQMSHLQNPSDLSAISLSSLNRIEKTLNQFLKLSLPLENNRDEFYPYEVVDELSTVIEAIGLLKDIDIEYNIDRSIQMINFQKDYLRFVILNLIQNIANHIKNKGTIRINLERLDLDYVVYNIQSDISDSKIKFINKNDDSEIILMTSKIIESNGGKLKIDNKKNIISITIPYN